MLSGLLCLWAACSVSAQSELKSTEEATVLFVERSDKGILLEWNSPEEVKPGYFNVERSTSDGDFELISVVFAAGNTVSMTGYALKLTEEEPPNANYRVVFVEHEGEVAVSKKEFKTIHKYLPKKNLAQQDQ